MIQVQGIIKIELVKSGKKTLVELPASAGNLLEAILTVLGEKDARLQIVCLGEVLTAKQIYPVWSAKTAQAQTAAAAELLQALADKAEAAAERERQEREALRPVFGL